MIYHILIHMQICFYVLKGPIIFGLSLYYAGRIKLPGVVRVEDFSKVLKALSDETRLKIIDLLLNYDFCVGALSRKLNISEAAVSQHLQVLRRAGLVTGEKRGYYTHYDLNKELFKETAAALLDIATCDVTRSACRQHVTNDHRYCANKNPFAEK